MPKEQPRFPVGTKVRVRPGTVDPDFDDVPLGGWAGTVRDTEAGADPPTCLVEWDRHTLANMHPVFRKRCERDGLDEKTMWLAEDDVVADDGSPVVLDQPTAIRTRPLDPANQEDRIRAVFGLTTDDPLPFLDTEPLLAYHDHLRVRLPFPFAGVTSRSGGRAIKITVVGLADADEDEEEFLEEGLMCVARQGQAKTRVPLSQVRAAGKGPHQQLLEDYRYWLASGR